MSDIDQGSPKSEQSLPQEDGEKNLKTSNESNAAESTISEARTEPSDHNIDDKLDFEDEGDALNKSKGENSECDDGEDGQCSPEKKNTKEKKEEDGEGSEEGELEDGELKEDNPSKKQVCRFFSRGLCFYGSVCRFLHLNNNKGSYNMFAPTSQYQHVGVEYSQHGHKTSSTMASTADDPHEESAWERGLREAKELVKKANKRKQQPDFENKKMNLSLAPDDDFYSSKIRKDETRDLYPDERDTFRGYDPIRDYEAPSQYDPYEEPMHMRYQREDFYKGHHLGDRRSPERLERAGPSRSRGLQDRVQDYRMQDAAQTGRSEPKYFDPWRRSKSPTRRSASRSSFGSYSTVSSFSPSSYSSYSSCSRSSSRSRSPRSPPSAQESFQRKQFGNQPHPYMPSGSMGNMPSYNKYPPVKRKYNERNERPQRPRSIPRNKPPGRLYPVNRERARSPPRERSRSRSLSMDSITSSTSSQSSGSVTGKGQNKNESQHTSILKKQATEKKPEFPLKSSPEKSSSAFPSASIQQAVEPPRQNAKQLLNLIDMEEAFDPLEDQFLNRTQSTSTSSFSSSQQFLPSNDRPKEPVRGLHKQPIKLTLLNKPAMKSTTLPKKEIETPKAQPEPETPAPVNQLVPKSVQVTNPPQSKKSANSRRVELLKQLKAVEDAIARKRAKFC